MKMNSYWPHPGNSQQGAALIISLIMLLLLTIVGLGSMRETSLQELMAGNAYDANVAFQSADAGMRAAELYLQNASLDAFNGSNGRYAYCSPSETATAACILPSWSNRSSTGWAQRSGSMDVYAQPQYIIQELPRFPALGASLASDEIPPMIELYRIIARGFGRSTNSMAAIESTYRRN